MTNRSPLSRRTSVSCLSDLRLDAWLAAMRRGVPDRDDAEIRAHLAACQPCGHRREALERNAAQFFEKVPLAPVVAATTTRARPPSRFLVWALAPVAMAAAAVLMIVVSPTDGIRAKGAP